MKKISLEKVQAEGVSHDPEILKQVLLKRGDAPHLTAFSCATLRPGQTAHAHAHADMFEVFFAQSGSGTIEIAGKKHALVAGTCILVEPNEQHEISNTGNADLVLLYFGLEA